MLCEQNVHDFCLSHGISSCGILVGVSGGSDSVALFHILARLRERLSLSGLGIAHVNHGLRGAESDREECFVRALSEKYETPFYLKKLNGKTLDDPGIEQWAREERYAFFDFVQREHGYTYVATGHTANDQAETVLLRLMRGSGIRGLCGILPVRDDRVIRPLLHLQKHAIESWLTDNNYSWQNDSSNADLKFTRNFIRHSVMPLFRTHDPDAVEHISALAGFMQGCARLLQPLVEQWISKNAVCGEEKRFVIKKPFSSAEPFLVSESIAYLFRKHGITCEKKHIEEFLENIHRTHGHFLLPDGWCYYPGEKEVTCLYSKNYSGHTGFCSYSLTIPGTTIIPQTHYSFDLAVFSFGECDIEYDTSNRIVFLDADKCGESLTFRPVEKDDMFFPLGFSCRVNVREYLKKQRHPVFYRNTMGVIADSLGTIVWIPSVAVSHLHRITPETKRIYKIMWL